MKKSRYIDFYSSKYFIDTYNMLFKENSNDISIMQFKTFYKDKDGYMVCGTEECIELLKQNMSRKDFKSLIIYYYKSGTIIKDTDHAVLSITGKYYLFSKFENLIDSILARRSSISTNCYRMLKIINSSKIVYMSDRSDDYIMQPYDGYCANIAGINNFSGLSQISLIENKKDLKVFGSMPHAFIQQYKGDLNKVIDTVLKYKPKNEDLILLIDYDNDIIGSLKTILSRFNVLNGIRIDTSPNLSDKSSNGIKGVNTKLIIKVRKFLDENKGKHIKIICSSNNNLETVSKLVKEKAPINMFGIGSSLTKLSLHFTADLVKLNNKLESKVGRKYLSVEKMIKY